MTTIEIDRETFHQMMRRLTGDPREETNVGRAQEIQRFARNLAVASAGQKAGDPVIISV